MKYLKLFKKEDTLLKDVLIITRFKDYLNETNINNDNIWYHGSKIKFDKFKLKQGTLFDIDYTSPIFLTSNINFAKAYAGDYTPYIYTIKLLTDNIMDFRKLPEEYDIKEDDIIANNLINFIYDNWDNTKYNFYWGYPEKCYSNLLSGEYSEVERTWVYDWLKLNNFDGAYLIETGELNVLIFDESSIEILEII